MGNMVKRRFGFVSLVFSPLTVYRCAWVPTTLVDGGLKTTVAIKLWKGANPRICSLIPKLIFCPY